MRDTGRDDEKMEATRKWSRQILTLVKMQHIGRFAHRHTTRPVSCVILCSRHRFWLYQHSLHAVNVFIFLNTPYTQSKISQKLAECISHFFVFIQFYVLIFLNSCIFFLSFYHYFHFFAQVPHFISLQNLSARTVRLYVAQSSDWSYPPQQSGKAAAADPHIHQEQYFLFCWLK